MKKFIGFKNSIGSKTDTCLYPWVSGMSFNFICHLPFGTAVSDCLQGTGRLSQMQNPMSDQTMVTDMLKVL